MKREVGVWIDHTKAVLFTVSDEGAGLKRISSRLEKHEISAKDYLDKRFAKQLDDYFNEVIAQVREAASILIFGPGEAKIELKKRLDGQELEGKIVGLETVEIMSDSQIVAKVRQRFLS